MCMPVCMHGCASTYASICMHYKKHNCVCDRHVYIGFQELMHSDATLLVLLFRPGIKNDVFCFIVICTWHHCLQAITLDQLVQHIQNLKSQSHEVYNTLSRK